MIFLILKVFIIIHKYANQMIFKSDNRKKKDICLSFNFTPLLVL